MNFKNHISFWVCNAKQYAMILLTFVVLFLLTFATEFTGYITRFVLPLAVSKKVISAYTSNILGLTTRSKNHWSFVPTLIWKILHSSFFDCAASQRQYIQGISRLTGKRAGSSHLVSITLGFPSKRDGLNQNLWKMMISDYGDDIYQLPE